MNTKHSFWNRLFAALLLAVMLVTQTTTAFAVEDSPEPTEPSMVQAQDSDTGTEEVREGTDTPEDELVYAVQPDMQSAPKWLI